MSETSNAAIAPSKGRAPITDVMPRAGKGTGEEHGGSRPLPWAGAEQRMRKGGWFWLATVRPDGAPHVMPLFAAWSGSSLFIASKNSTRKSRNLVAEGRCVITTDTGDLHLIVEGDASRVADDETLRRASDAFREIYDWPTQVTGDRLDAEYGAPTSGGPPYDVFEIVPRKAFGFATDGESFAPTRWRFDNLELRSDDSGAESSPGPSAAPDRMCAVTEIAATPQAVFAVLADPSTHADIDGTGWVRESLDGDRITAAGQVFRMAMFHENAPGNHYEIANRVEVFDDLRSIAWQPGQESPETRELSLGGWIWRYDLEPTGPSGTTVTLTYDWSAVGPKEREEIQFPPFGQDHLDNSLQHLADLATQ